MDKDNPFHMWDYWQGKYGSIEALKDYYPETLKARVDLQVAISMIQNGERVVNSIMEDLSEESWEEEHQ